MTESLLFCCGGTPTALPPYSNLQLLLLGGPIVGMQQLLLVSSCVAMPHRREGDTFPDSTFPSVGNSREWEKGHLGVLCALVSPPAPSPHFPAKS